MGPENLQWSTPLPLSDRGEQYLLQLEKLPKAGPERLEFFQQYFEDKDDLLARDAYDEFAKAPYDIVQVAQAEDEARPVGRLDSGPQRFDEPSPVVPDVVGGVWRSGRPADVGNDDQVGGSQAAPDSTRCWPATCCSRVPRACRWSKTCIWRTRRPSMRTPMRRSCPCDSTATTCTSFRRLRVVQSLRIMLNRPNLADLVIPDLARWEDWSSMDRLVKLFKEADEKTSWVKVPVINFLRICPLPEAKERIKELEKLDPESVRRANTFFPVPTPAAAPAKS